MAVVLITVSSVIHPCGCNAGVSKQFMSSNLVKVTFNLLVIHFSWILAKIIFNIYSVSRHLFLFVVVVLFLVSLIQ